MLQRTDNNDLFISIAEKQQNSKIKIQPIK